jgi:hypothetical protein
LSRIVGIFVAGLLALLPILVTVIVTTWVAQVVQSYAGPGSMVGRLIVLPCGASSGGGRSGCARADALA